MDHLSELPGPIARALEALDAEAARRAARLDVERTAARVLARLRAEPEAEMHPALRLWAAPWSLRVAAAVGVLVVAAAVATVSLRPGGGAGSGKLSLPVAVQGVDSLGQTETDALLRAVDEIRPLNAAAPEPSIVSVEDLSEQELRALLVAMQSSEGEI